MINETQFFEVGGKFAWRTLLRGVIPPKRDDVAAWVQAHIDMSFDHTADAHGLVRLRPYQIEPLRATERHGVRQVTLAWSQRTGKSQTWKFSLCHRVAMGGVSGIVSFPAERDVDRAIRDTVKPLLETVPGVSRDWATRGNVKADGIHLPAQSTVLYWQGGQQQIISLSCNWAAMDEVDFHVLVNADEEGRNFDQIKALRLRMQTHREKMLILCSSVTTPSGAIWREYLAGSQETWCLRCLGCGHLIPTNRLAFRASGASGDEWRGLQWRKNEQGAIIPDSIRMICPVCGRAHVESEASAMNDAGAYVAAMPERTAHRSYQVGALASPDWSWLEIAQAQEAAVDSDGKKYLANAILSMPYAYSRENPGAEIEDVNRMRMVDYPADIGQRISIIVAGVDVQKSELAGNKYFVYAVRAFDEAGNSWQMRGGIGNAIDDVSAVLDAEYFGHRVSLAMFDHGGFDNTYDVTPYIVASKNAVYYKGQSAKNLDGRDYVRSRDPNIWLCNAVGYQVRLLDLLYSPPRPAGYAWYLRTDCQEDMFAQLCAVRPNRRLKYENAESYANWSANGRRDYFDAEKMALCALDIACDNLPASAFPAGHKPAFWVRSRLLEIARKKRLGQTS